jgi:hypothetical protein
MRVRVHLRQPLFVLPGTGSHAPRNASVLEGEVLETTAFGLKMRVSAYFDEAGKALSGDAVTLILPGAKVDHVHVLG